MMKLMFVILDSKMLSEEPNHEWINIGYLVSAVKDLKWLDIAVELVNVDDIDECIDSILNLVSDNKPDIIGFSVYQFNINAFKSIAKRLKLFDSTIRILAGGVEISMNSMYFMESVPELDYAILDEGEITLHEMLQLIRNEEDLTKCRGILFRKNGDIIRTEDRPIVEDIDAIRFPSKEFYKSPLLTHFLICSRGCTGHCTFCAYKKSSVRCRSFKNIFEEIREVQEKYDCQYFHILDGAFGDGAEDLAGYYRNFYNEIVKSGLRFCYSFYMRSEQVNEDTIIELKKLNSVGLDYVFIGMEAGNAEDLKIYGKKAKLEDNIRAIKLLDEAGINAECGCILFNPYSNREKLIKNIEFIKENNVFLNVSRLSSRLAVYSGTPIIKMLAKDGLLNQSPDTPILDGYGYRFADKDMEKLWEIFSKIDQRIQEKSHKNFYKGISTSIKLLSYIYNLDCNEINTDLQNYKEFCFKFSYDIFYNVLENYNNPTICDSLLQEADNHVEKLSELEKSIEHKKIMLLRRAIRNNNKY
jgi:anaerobic magnesium-protoporphyrin IX monomethyl ester cyclase